MTSMKQGGTDRLIPFPSSPPRHEVAIGRWLEKPRVRQDVVAIPVIWLTFAVSILIHVGVLFIWIPRTPLFAHRGQEEDQTSERLQVRIAAEAIPTPPTPAPESRQETPALTQLPRTPPPRTAPPPRPRVQTPPVIALPSPPPSVVPLPAPAAPAPAPPRVSPPMEGDFSALIEAKRRERGEREVAQGDEKAQLNRNIAAANLPSPARGVAAQETKRGGGIFEIKRMAYDDAAFEFFGWNTTMGRRTPQLIEVRRGDNSDMRIAVVRKMIAIIRQFEKEDFVWESTRRDRKFVLSARLSDNAALEDFLMHEFFDDGRNAQ